jgi:hypothetical protein
MYREGAACILDTFILDPSEYLRGKPMKLYFVRHGESEDNAIREISNCGWKQRLALKVRADAQGWQF